MKKNKSLYFIISAFGIEIFCAQVILIFLPLSVIASGGSDTLAANLRSLAYTGPVFFGYFIGRTVDTLNKRYLGCGIALLLTLMTGLAGSVLPEISVFESCLLLLTVSVGTYILNNLRSSVIPLIATPAQLPEVNSKILIIENSALILAPLMASLLLSTNRSDLGFILISAMFFIAGMLYLFSLEKTSDDAKIHSNSLSFPQSLRVLINKKPLLHAVFIVMGNNAFTGIYLLHILIYAIETRIFTSTSAPYLLIAFAAGAIISGLSASAVIERYSNRTLALTCCTSMILCGSVPIIIPTECSFYISSFLVGFFESYVVIAVWTMRQKLVPPKVLGTVTGITSMLFKLSMIVTIPIAGLLSQAQSAAWAILFGMCAVVIGMLPMLTRSIVDTWLNRRGLR